MKKLFLLPLTVLALAACNVNPTPKPTPGPTGGDTLNKAAIGISEKGYIKSDHEFTFGGANWVARSGVVQNGSDYYNHEDGSKGDEGADPGYGALGVMQIKKATSDAIKNTTAYAGKTKLTITFYATYENQAPQYFPTVKQGTEAGDCYALIANEESTAGVAATGYINWSNGKSYQIYKHVCTYDLNSGSFFELGSGSSAVYVLSWLFE